MSADTATERTETMLVFTCAIHGATASGQTPMIGMRWHEGRVRPKGSCVWTSRLYHREGDGTWKRES